MAGAAAQAPRERGSWADRRVPALVMAVAAGLAVAVVVALGVTTARPAWGALLVAAPVAMAAMGSVRSTVLTGVLATAAALGLDAAGRATDAERALLVAAVLLGSAAAVLVARVRTAAEGALADAEQARRHEEAQRRDAEARARPYRLAAALAGCRSVADVADTTFDALRSDAGAAGGMLSALEDDAGGSPHLRSVAAFGYRPDVLRRWPDAPLADDVPTTAVVRTGDAVFAASASALAADWPRVAADVTASGFEAVCLLPLLVSARVVGVLAVSWAEERDFGDDDRRFLQALAGQCAQAVERARLSEEERLSRRRLAFLGDVSRLLSSSLEPADVLTRLADLVVGSVADACAVVVPEGPTLRRQALAGRDRQVTALAADLAAPERAGAEDGDRSVLAAAWARGVPVSAEVRLDDAGADTVPGDAGADVTPDGDAAGLAPDGDAGADETPDGDAPGLAPDGDAPGLAPDGDAAGLAPDVGVLAGAKGSTASVLAVPLEVGGNALGVMLFVSGVHTPPLLADDRSLATEVAARAATALDNATRYDRERHTATLLQQAVLPDTLPVVDGVVLDAVYRAGTAGTQVGGDWFDAVPLDDGRLLVSVGDVMGKGAAAAALMSQVRAAIRAYGVIDPRPATLLARLDRLVATFGDTRLVTAVVGVVDPSDGRVVLASAGHPPAVVVGPGRCQVIGGGRHRILGVDGSVHPSGAAGDGERRRQGAMWAGARATVAAEVATTLGPRDTLVLYSDGLVERRAETLADGVARLCTVAVDCLELEPWWQRSADCLARSMLEGDGADDDVVVLTLALPGADVEGAASAPGVSWLVLPPESSSAPAARRWLRGRLAARTGDDAVDRDVAQRAELLVAELVANAVLHARTDVAIGIRVDGGAVHAEVSDQSPVLPEQKRFGPEAATGRGLLLVEELADRWGVVGHSAGKVVWFDVGVPAPTGSAPGAEGAAGAGPAPGDIVVMGPPTLSDQPVHASGGPGGGDAGTATVPVALLGVPVDLAMSAAAHYDGLERELQLPSDRAAGAGQPPDRLVDEVLRETARAGTVVTATLGPVTTRVGRAAAEGRTVVDVHLDVAPGAGSACRQVNVALDEIERWCRQGLLLAVPATPVVAAFRRWMLGQVADQSLGRPARPWEAPRGAAGGPPGTANGTPGPAIGAPAPADRAPGPAGATEATHGA